MTHCPCCGRTMLLETPADIGASIPMSCFERRAFDVLAKRFGAWTPSWQLIDAVYSDAPDGGPENDRVAIGAVVTNLRRKLKGTGLMIGYVAGRNEGIRRLMWEAKPN